jgi:hypothetical protein
MKSILKTSLVVFSSGVALTAVVLFLLYQIEGRHPPADRVEYYAIYFDVVKTLWVGIAFVVLSVLIPAGVGEVRHAFERLKESRIAYSEAKTGVDYLPLRVSSLPLKEASALIQQVHVHKHQAELYEELELHLRRRGYQGTPEEWGDMLYYELLRVRDLLEKHSGQWDNLQPDARLKIVQKTKRSEKET